MIENRLVRFIFEVRGKGTKELARAKEGDRLDILGPLGNSFDISFSDETGEKQFV